MMSDIGVLTSVTTVAGAGLRLALLLNAVACQVANSGVDIHSISKAISLFSATLKHVGQSLHANDSVRTRECLETAQAISEQAQTVFGEIEDMLDKVQKSDSYLDLPVQQRFKLCFKKQRVTYLLAQIESLKLSLAVMLQVLQLGRLLEIRSVVDTLTDDMIAQERADAQNMLIVRYWSIKRLDRLWDLARQEALDAEKEVPTRTVDSNLQVATSPLSVQNPAHTIRTSLSKLPVIYLGVDTSLSAMEESPKDMLRLTEDVLEALLARWIRIMPHRQPIVSKGYGAQVPRVYVSSGSDDEFSADELNHPSPRGYYLEGPTTDWRRPHSQEARLRAAHLRKHYSDKQAHVHSDSDDSDASRSTRRRAKTVPNRTPITSDESDQFPEQGQLPNFSRTHYGDSIGQPRETKSQPYAFSIANTGAGNDQGSPVSNWRHGDVRPKPHAAPGVQPQPPPAQETRPIPMPIPQRYKNGRADRLATSQPSQMPTSLNRGAAPDTNHQYYLPQPNGFPPSAPSAPAGSAPYAPGYQYQQTQLPRHNSTHHGFGRAMSDNGLPPQQVQPLPQYLTSTTPHHRSSRSRKGAHSPSSHDRHKDLKRTAARGILGVSAIAGFMDALEAFSFL